MINNKIINTLACLILTACSNDNSKNITEMNGMAIIDYNKNGINPPSVEDYLDAGIVDVNINILGQLNDLIKNKPFQEIDTVAEIQELVNNLNKEGNSKPEITLIGENTQQLTIGSSYIELGAIANDYEDGDITKNIVIDSTNVNTNAEGNYTVTYNVSDSTGNSAIQKTRTVEVLPLFININNKTTHISLSSGIKQKLRFINGEVVKWESDNPAIDIDNQGYIFASKNTLPKDSKASITAKIKNSEKPIKFDVTIVNWRANLSTLILETPSAESDTILLNDNNTIYYTNKSKVYSSTDCMKTGNEIADFPITDYSMGRTPYTIKTPYSYYIRSKNKIYSTNDFIYYNEILTSEPSGHATKLGGLKHAFSYDKKKKHLYAGEYSVNELDNKHAVYKGVIDKDGLKDWKKVLEFDSENENTTDTVRHIHIVAVDPFTSRVWVGTGDTPSHSRLYYSDDNGENFKLFAIGSQYFRTLGIWFTKDYIYWNTDSGYVKQVISRIERKKLSKNILTPKLSSGNTKVGVKYYIYKTDGNTFPKSVGEIYKEDSPRQLDAENVVYAIDDPMYNYRETVAKLENSAHWYHLVVKTNKEEEIVLMSTAAETSENFSRDNRPRVFGIKEKKDGTVDVQELLSISNKDKKPYKQLIPYFQDKEGNIYFRGLRTKNKVYKAKLYWKDQIKLLP